MPEEKRYFAQPIYDMTPLMPESMRDAIPVYIDTIHVFHQLKIPFAITGGLAMLEYGRTRATKDIDFLVFKQDAIHLLDYLQRFGYRTQRTDDSWVYHAFKRNQIIDILFALGKGFLGDDEGVVLSDELLSRARHARLDGAEFLVLAPEDLLHSKILVSWKDLRQEDFQDVLLIIRNARSMDWDYLLQKVSKYPVRMLAMLSYAVSCQITEDYVPGDIKSEIEALSTRFLSSRGLAA